MNIRIDMEKKKLDSLKINKSPGPDLLHPRLLKEVSGVLSKPLANIFQTPIYSSSCIVPAEWRRGSIVSFDFSSCFCINRKSMFFLLLALL